MSVPLVVVGAGGHAKVVIDTLREMEAELLGLVDSDAGKVDTLVMGVPVFDEEGFLADHEPGSLRLCSGIAFVAPRRSTFKRLKSRDYQFAAVIHPSAVIAGGVIIGEGGQVMAGAVVQPEARIGDNVLVNTRASIDHDCIIGNHSHVAPGAVLAGSVHVGEGVHIGAGATVLENLWLGDNCTIGAGAVVTEDVQGNATVVGVPARLKRA